MESSTFALHLRMQGAFLIHFIYLK